LLLINLNAGVAGRVRKGGPLCARGVGEAEREAPAEAELREHVVVPEEDAVADHIFVSMTHELSSSELPVDVRRAERAFEVHVRVRARLSWTAKPVFFNVSADRRIRPALRYSTLDRGN